MRLPFIFKNRAGSSPDQLLHQQCQLPSCKQPEITNTSSFSHPHIEIMETPKASFSTSTSKYANISSESEDYCYYGCLKDESLLETIVRGVQSSSSERLFFEPEQTKSISRNDIKFKGDILPFKESVAVVLASKDPYGDFKKSMQEMIESSHGLKYLLCLEKLLGWYLKMNDKRHHGLIVEAFVDMFLEFATSSCSNSTSSFSSAEPSFASSSVLSRVGI